MDFHFSMTRSNRGSWRNRLLNRRGAVFLLAVYFAALTLLLLGGISLQRTNTEVRAAQVSRDQQQAFWLAEGALDKALLTLAANPKNVAPYTTQGLNGTYGYTVTSLATSFDENGNMTVTQRITGEGTASASSITSRVSGVVSTISSINLHGLVVNGQIQLEKRPIVPSFFYKSLRSLSEDDERYFRRLYSTIGLTITGDIRTTSGKPRSVYDGDYNDITVKGDVIVNLPDPINPYSGVDTGAHPAIDRNLLGPGDITGDKFAEAITPFGPPELPVECQNQELKPWVVEAGKYKITNKDATLNSSRSDGVVTFFKSGTIFICASDVTIKEGAKVTFADPTLVYVKGGGFGNDGEVQTTDNFHNNIVPRGLIVALTDGGATPGDFEGSIYAPKGWVEIGPSPNDMGKAQDLLDKLKEDRQTLEQLKANEYKDLPAEPAARMREIERRQMEIFHWNDRISADQDAIVNALENLPSRTFGFIVGDHILVDGTDVTTHKPGSEKKGGSSTPLPLLSWTN